MLSTSQRTGGSEAEGRSRRATGRPHGGSSHNSMSRRSSFNKAPRLAQQQNGTVTPVVASRRNSVKAASRRDSLVVESPNVVNTTVTFAIGEEIPMVPWTKDSEGLVPQRTSRKALMKVAVIVGTPLVLSLILCIVGVIVIISVNIKYAKEAAETFPRELMKPLAYHVKREVESEIHEMHRVYTEISAAHRTNMMKIPAYNYHQGSNRVYNTPSGAAYQDPPTKRIANDVRVMAEFAKRVEWRHQTSATSIRVMKGNAKSTLFSLAFLSDASSYWYTRVDGLGDSIFGATYYGEDVRRAELLQPPEDGTTNAKKQIRVEEFNTVDPSNDYKFIDDTQNYVIMMVRNDKVYQQFESEDAVIKGRIRSVTTTTVQPLPFFNLQMFYNGVEELFELQLEIIGPIYDFTNTLVGRMSASVNFAGIEAALARVTPPSAQYTVASYVMDETGILATVSGYNARDVLTVEHFPDLDTYNESSWPPIPPRCIYLPMAVDNYTRYVVMLICSFEAKDFKDPIVRASAPHLASLCAQTTNVTASGDDDGLNTTAVLPNPLLGQAQTVVLEVNDTVTGGVRRDAHTIVCDRVDIGSKGLRLTDPSLQADWDGVPRPPVIYDSWRVVTIVSEKEIVDPLLGDFESKSIVVGVAGACAAAAMCLVAASISILLLWRSGVGVSALSSGDAESMGVSTD